MRTLDFFKQVMDRTASSIRKRIQRFQKSTYTLILIFCLGVPLMRITKLYVNQSDSLPQMLFLSFKGVIPSKHDLIVFHHPHHPQGILTKRVIGIAGDRIHYKEGRLYVGEISVGPQFNHQTDGRPLTPIEAGVIPEGHYFVSTDHPRSLDSRYQEIGLVRSDQLKGKAVVLW